METSKNVPKDFAIPDGGWGYIIAICVIIMNCVSKVPIIVFPILYGNYLATLGDEASLTAIVLDIFLGMTALTGVFTGFIITKYGHRITGFIGAVLYFLGTVGEHFVTSFFQLVIYTSVLKGIGFSCMQTSSMTLLNIYFDKKLNIVMGMLQSFIALGSICGPILTTYLMKNLGTKHTIWLYTGFSSLNFLAMATYKPVSRKPKNLPESLLSTGTVIISSSESDLPVVEPMLRGDKQFGIEKATSVWVTAKSWILDDIGFRLFSQLKFWNIGIGLAIACNSDNLFVHLIRAFMNSLHYKAEDIAFTLMIFFASDFVGRISFAIMSGFWSFKNRHVFLTASILINFFRMMFFFRDDFVWKLTIVAIVGWLRAFIETLAILVIAGEYKDDFVKAFSTYHIITGIISFSTSYLTSFIKTFTENDAMVIYVYAGINYMCCLAWFMEKHQGNLWKWFSRGT